MRNLEGHQVDAHGAFASGADVGIVATVLAAVFPVVVAPLVVGDIDVWTFWRTLSTVVLADDSAQPLTGFVVGSVLVGIGVHLCVGTLVGALLTVAITYLDIDTFVAIIVTMLSLFVVLLLLLVWLPLSQTLVPALDDVPILFVAWAIVAFVVLLGVGVAQWRTRWDTTYAAHPLEEIGARTLVAHERALAVLVATLALVVVGIAVSGVAALRVEMAVPYLAVHVGATAQVAWQAVRARRALSTHAGYGAGRASGS